MTRCKLKIRPVWHETSTIIDNRALCVAERPSCVLLRLKGTRTTLMLPWSAVFLRAATMRAQEQVKAKLNRRGSRGRNVARGVL